jgi:hypothetical protein
VGVFLPSPNLEGQVPVFTFPQEQGGLVITLGTGLMRTYFWISLFTSYRITANQLIESNVILIANKELKNYVQECSK